MTEWIVGKLIETPNGTIFQNADGNLSLNPSRSTPPYGPYTWGYTNNAGQYELNAVDGGLIAYNPTLKEVVMFAYKETLPMQPGMSAISRLPL